jgi:hypothetical protein
MLQDAFTHYWKADENAASEGEPLTHIASDTITSRGVKPGDFVFCFNVKSGKAYLIARMQVERITDATAAKEFLGCEVQFAERSEHCVCTPTHGTIIHFDRPLSLEIERQLRFDSPSGPVGLAFASEDEIDPQTLRPIRKLTADSATLLHAIIDADPTRVHGAASGGWTQQECGLIVADYFQMLREELLGVRYSKTEHRRQLRRLIDRKDASIEFKHANISAVLVEQAQPYIEGYKPRGNYQGLLAESVADFLELHRDFFTSNEMLAAIEPTHLPASSLPVRAVDAFDLPPEIIINPATSKPWLSRRGQRIDFALRDAKNRKLGELGEQFAIDLERRRLIEAGRDDLAGRVEWIVETCGDGVGFDVLSFDEQTDSEKWLEVKTTGLGKYHPFLVTDLEVRCSESKPEYFTLFRIFDFRNAPRVYKLPGALSQRCQLVPTIYRAGVPEVAECET